MRTEKLLARNVLAATLFLGVAACDDIDLTSLEPLPIGDVVVTIRDTTYDFGAAQTFTVVDSVVHLVARNGTQLAVTRDYDDEVLARVRQHMIERGYVENTTPGTVRSDITILVGATASRTYDLWVGYEWWSYYGWYPGWFYNPGYGAGWTIGYPVAYVETVDVGTLVIDMIDSGLSATPVSDQRIRSIWAGAARGLLEGNASLDRVNEAIDEMFRQSPYIARNVVNPLDAR